MTMTWSFSSRTVTNLWPAGTALAGTKLVINSESVLKCAMLLLSSTEYGETVRYRELERAQYKPLQVGSRRIEPTASG